ncbi:MAG: DUF1499 domain-containing protein [Gammaproteobacteria bacterium]
MIFSGKRPTNLGVKNHKLLPCPDSPNCACSQNVTDNSYDSGNSNNHKIAPFIFGDNPENDMLRLKNILIYKKGLAVITSNKNYIHAECKTPMMGFVDDLEFYCEPDQNICHVRSASRLGHSDFGKNRSRIEEIRLKFISTTDQ